jgi:hypothetical protein
MYARALWPCKRGLRREAEVRSEPEVGDEVTVRCYVKFEDGWRTVKAYLGLGEQGGTEGGELFALLVHLLHQPLQLLGHLLQAKSTRMRPGHFECPGEYVPRGQVRTIACSEYGPDFL